MSAPIFPIGEVAKADCKHVAAGPRDHLCPACKGILRRCCQSVVGYPHVASCPAVEQRGR